MLWTMNNEQQQVTEDPIQIHKLENESHDGGAITFVLCYDLYVY